MGKGQIWQRASDIRTTMMGRLEIPDLQQARNQKQRVREQHRLQPIPTSRKQHRNRGKNKNMVGLRIGFGGSSCSGKSTIAYLLSRMLPRAKVLMQDQFFKREELIPTAMDGATRDWDCPEGTFLDFYL